MVTVARRLGSFLGAAVGIALPIVPLSLAAQSSAASAWSVSAPDAALAWFTVLADWRVDGDGAFSYIADGRGLRPTSGDAARLQRLRSDAARSVLHFAPLYYPSPLAEALARATPSTPRAEQLLRWQQRLDSIYVPALAAHLARERLDGGRLVVAPALGAEGRLFAATNERRDNFIAVGTFSGDPDPEAPLLAFVREVCFPAVSRAASAARIGPASPNAARRASLAAVRCGAVLLDACLPSRSVAYQAFWLRRAEEAQLATRRARTGSGASASRAEFDRVFPVDAPLEVRLECATPNATR